MNTKNFSIISLFTLSAICAFAAEKRYESKQVSSLTDASQHNIQAKVFTKKQPSAPKNIVPAEPFRNKQPPIDCIIPDKPISIEDKKKLKTKQKRDRSSDYYQEKAKIKMIAAKNLSFKARSRHNTGIIYS